MRSWRCVLPVAAALGSIGDARAVERLPVETFSRQFTYEQVGLSPDGAQLAVTYQKDDANVLAVLAIAGGDAKPIAGVRNPDSLGTFWWKSDTRLIFLAHGHDMYNPSIPVLTAINADGGNRIQLNYNPQRSGLYTYDWLVDLAWEDPQSALIVSETAKVDYPVVYRVNLERSSPLPIAVPSGGEVEWPTARRSLFQSPGRECSYQTDNAGVVRTCLTTETDNTTRLLHRPGPDARWEELAHFRDGDGIIDPVGFTPDDRLIYVFSNVGRDTRALFLYDPQTRILGELLFEAEGVDVGNVLYAGDGRRVAGVTYFKKNMGVFYLDNDLVQTHTALNKVFPGLQVRLLSFSRDNQRMIVWVGNASTPGAFYFFDMKKKELQKITDIAPWIDRAKMAVTRSVAFDARDGMHINGYLTVPRDLPEKNLPLIVNVHGGPHGVRDYAVFDRETQLFANRGYAVLQVNYRGSGGYGREFLTAGHREWGRKMQLDLEDGVKWLVQQGTVDPARVGIFGASYGGYAAMMALITSPDIFKCGVTQAGVSNLVRKLNSRSVMSRSGLRRSIGKDERIFWEDVIGDRKDEEALKAISPLFNVDRIKVPVFIAHGADDLVVPAIEATDLHKALRRAGKTVEFLLIPREGHGFAREDSRTKFFRQLDEFFGRYLPTGQPPPVSSAAAMRR